MAVQSCLDGGGGVSENETTGRQTAPGAGGDRLALWALGLLLGGGAAALAFSVVWGQWMKISDTVDAEDRVRGWAAVVRTVPTAAVAWSIPLAAMVLAVRACGRGSVSLGRAVIWLCGVVLFVVSISIIGGTVESALGSHPELKWMLLPVSIAISAGSAVLALRAANRQIVPQ